MFAESWIWILDQPRQALKPLPSQILAGFFDGQRFDRYRLRWVHLEAETCSTLEKLKIHRRRSARRRCRELGRIHPIQAGEKIGQLIADRTFRSLPADDSKMQSLAPRNDSAAEDHPGT